MGDGDIRLRVRMTMDSLPPEPKAANSVFANQREPGPFGRDGVDSLGLAEFPGGPVRSPSDLRIKQSRYESRDGTTSSTIAQNIGSDQRKRDGGEGGIRTRGGRKPTHAFQACSFSLSDTSPPKKEADSSPGPRRIQPQDAFRRVKTGAPGKCPSISVHRAAGGLSHVVGTRQDPETDVRFAPDRRIREVWREEQLNGAIRQTEVLFSTPWWVDSGSEGARVHEDRFRRPATCRLHRNILVTNRLVKNIL